MRLKKALSLCAALCVLLAGCGHTHEWQEATCTAPKTCADCGETEGEPLPHTWQEATCAAPKTCTVCNTTEGESLPHTLTEANYQSPATCTVCGATEGEPLPAAFEEAGYTFVEEGKEYDYVTVENRDPSLTTVGTATFTDYQASDLYTISGTTVDPIDGYQWRTVKFNLVMPNTQTMGYKYSVTYFDYYSGEEILTPFKFNFNGKECDILGAQNPVLRSEWVNGVGYMTMELAMRVPVDYDGLVLCFYNSAYSEPLTGKPIKSHLDVADADPLFFRMV